MLFPNYKIILIQSLIVFIGLMMNSLHLQAQYTPKFYNYTNKNGLPSNETYYVIQDAKGYIWCSTDYGVVRYNGEEFKLFSVGDGLTDRSVFDLFEDHLGRIWCLTYNKKLCYIENDSIIEFPYNDRIKAYVPRSLIPLNILVDTNETVFFSLKSYGILSITKNGVFNLSTIDPSRMKSDEIRLWIKKTNRKQIIAQKISSASITKKYMSLSFLKNKEKLIRSFYSTKFIASGGRKSSVIEHQKKVFFSNRNIIYSCNGDSIRQELVTNNIISLYSDGVYLWVGYYQKGVTCYKVEPEGLVKKQHFLKKNSISSVLRDHKGGYWFTSLDNGLFYTSNLNLETWPLSTNSKISAIDGNGTSEIYVTHEIGILEIIKNNQKQVLKLEDREITFQDVQYSSQDNNVYIGANVLYKYDPETSSLEKQPLLNRKVSVNKIHLHKNTLWFGGKRGLGKKSILNKKNKASYTFLQDEINDFYLENDSNIIIITKKENDLFKYQKDTFIRLNWLEDYPKAINFSCVSKIGHKYVFGTKSNGLFFVENTKFIYCINKKAGLITNQIHCMHPLSETELLVGTDKGITLIKFKKNEYQLFTLEDFEGLIDKRVIDIFSRQDSIWTAHPDGLTKFHKNAFFQAKEKDQVILEQVWVNDLARKELLNLDTIVLPYYESRVEFKFIPNNYRRTTYWYKYKMEGEDNRWKKSQNPFITYSSLDPGVYVFQISTSPNGRNYGPTKYIVVYIQKPFWGTWWFKITLILSCISLIYGYAQYKIKAKIKKIKTQEAIKQQMFELKSVALKAQINPHFFFNVLNSLQGVILDEPSEIAYNYHNKFTQLMRLVLMQSDEQSIAIKKEFKALKLYIELEQFRTNNAFKVNIDIDPLLESTNLYVPSMLLQPFVENAIWHGLMNRKDAVPKKINIQIKKKEGYIESIIEDNGVGRAKAMEIREKKTHQHESMGTKISYNRLEIYKKQLNIDFQFRYEDLKDTTGQALGTRVFISFPYFVSKKTEE